MSSSDNLPQRRTIPPSSPRGGKGWKETIDSFGGPLVIGSVAAVLALVAALGWVNRQGGPAVGGTFEPITRSPVAGRTWGNPAAPIRIVAFEDFQCPFCAAYTKNVEPVIASEFIETGQVQYEFHHLAFLGEDSIRAAQAAECAVAQDQFWPYHDVLFLRQGRENAGVFTLDRLKAYAREVDAALAPQAWDQAAFEGCLDSGRTRPTVESMTRQANDTGAHSTPSLLINGRLLSGVQNIEQVRQAIADARSATRP